MAFSSRSAIFYLFIYLLPPCMQILLFLLLETLRYHFLLPLYSAMLHLLEGRMLVLIYACIFVCTQTYLQKPKSKTIRIL